MKISRWTMAALSAVWSVGMAVAQQPVHVQLNGQPVMTNAEEVNGRVLVPVRGVLEQLGATVDYISATQIVNANKNGMNVQLRIGSREAMVNGQKVTLDVPAQVIDGSTMVPLRFLSESFGADVSWDAQANLVSINTTGAAQTIEPQDTNVQVQTFDRQPPGIIGVGGGLVFTLTGTPGGVATVQIPGATDELPMTEASPGNYQCTVSFTAEHPVTLMHATAIARLKTDKGTKVVILSQPMDIDTAPPAVTQIWPKDTLVPNLRPSINALYNDGLGPGIDPSSITLLVDGQNVSQNVVTGGSYLTYSPNADLAAGTHTCELKITDRAGNVNDQTWSFTNAAATDLAKSIDLVVPASCVPGQQIKVTMLGAPNSTCTYSLGGRLDMPMTESSPGVYTAVYTIANGDDFYNDRVIGKIHTQDNQTFTLTSPQTVMTMPVALVIPTFSSPLADAAVGDSCAIQGSGPANARVHVWVEYRSTIRPGMPVTGTLYDAIVSTDPNGNFTTGPIKLDPGLASASDMRFTAHAEALGWDGKMSEPAVIVFKH